MLNFHEISTFAGFHDIEFSVKYVPVPRGFQPWTSLIHRIIRIPTLAAQIG
jgi:hypothetical protein